MKKKNERENFNRRRYFFFSFSFHFVLIAKQTKNVYGRRLHVRFPLYSSAFCVIQKSTLVLDGRSRKENKPISNFKWLTRKTEQNIHME